MSELIIPVIIFLIPQVFIHGERWKADQWISKKEKTTWAVARFFLFAAFAFLIAWKKEGAVLPFEAARFLLVQLGLFWIAFDIALPAYAGKPQLWNDPNLQDNNSFFDRLGGSWQGNLLLKAANLGFAFLLLAITEPAEAFPYISNKIALISLGILAAGIIIAVIIFNSNKKHYEQEQN